ncbi:MAG: recombinase family protein [Caldilineaceae bacterium]|nr:recombinase family protein [Caldilineaceae bacterium]
MRFVSWAAVSSLPQAKKVSLDDQKATNREHATRHGGQIVAELTVPGESRNIVLFEDACRRIDAYAQLRDLIAAKAFDVLIYLDRSRLGRKASLSMAVVELCHEAGILTYETENPPARLDQIQTSHDDMLIGAIKSVGAQREIEKLQERHRMGMMERVREGKLPAGVPWGWTATYDTDGNRTLTIDEPAAAAIRTMLLDLYLVQGLGLDSVAERLNETGVATPTGLQWEKSNVQGVMRLLWRYAGYSEVNRRGDRPYTRARGNWPPILSEDEAQSIEDEKKRRVFGRRGVATAYLFSTCVSCAECGNRMVYATHRRNRPGHKMQVSLRCSHHPRIPHRHTHISENKVRAALEEAIAYLQTPENRRAILADSQQTNAAHIETEAAQQQAQAAQIQEAIHRADDAYVSGRMDAERYQRQVERLAAQSAAIAKRLAELDTARKDADHEAHRATRLDEIAADGPAILDGDTRAANAWLKRHLRLWVEDNEVVRVEYL